MAPIALAFGVLATSGSPTDMSVILAAQTIPMVLFALLGGVAGDRYSRRRVLLVTNFGSGLCQAAVASALFADYYSLVSFAALAFMNGVLTSASQPSLRGIVPEIVPKGLLRQASSVLGSTKNFARVLGPSIAAGMTAWSGAAWALAFDSATYFVAAICLGKLALPSAPAASRGSLVTELKEGWSEFIGRRWVATVVTSFTFTNFVYAGIWTVLGPLIAAETFGIAIWGVVLSAQAAGMLISSVAMYRFAVIHLLPLGIAGVSLISVPLIVLGAGLRPDILIAAAFVAGLGVGVYAVAWETSLQEHIPREALSRVSSYDNLGSFVAVPLGQLAAGPAAGLIGATMVAAVGGVVYLVVALLPLGIPAVRHLMHKVAS